MKLSSPNGVKNPLTGPFSGRGPDRATTPGTAGAPGVAGAVDGGAKPIPAVPVVREVAAPRQLNRKALGGAILLVLLGGLLVLFALPAYAHQSDVLVVAHDVKAGQVVTAADLSDVKVSSGSQVASIPAGGKGAVVGKVALSDLPAGTLLASAMVGSQPSFTSGQAMVAVALKAGQMPAAGVTPGEAVVVTGTPGTSVGTASKYASSSYSAVVVDAGARDASTGVTVVDLRVASGDAQSVAAVSSTGSLSLVALPAGS